MKSNGGTTVRPDSVLVKDTTDIVIENIVIAEKIGTGNVAWATSIKFQIQCHIVLGQVFEDYRKVVSSLF